MADEGLLPEPDVGLDFSLPHDINAEGNAASPGNNAYELMDYSPVRDIEDKIRQTPAPNDNLVITKENVGLHEVLQNRPSDRGEAFEAFNVSSSKHLQDKKSLRTDDGENEESPKCKKPRQSLFGPPMENTEEGQLDDLFEEQSEELMNPGNSTHEPEILTPSIGSFMCSLNLEQQIGENHQPEPPFNFESGLAESEMDFMSPRVSPAPGQGDTTIPPDHQPIYGLRTGIDRNIASTYVDHDESGNFDPTKETRQRMVKLQQAKAARFTQRSKKGKQRASEERPLKFIVKLRFKNFGNVRNRTDDQYNWPDDWSEVDSEDEHEAQDIREWFRRSTPNRVTQPPIEDPLDKVDDLTGYPSARGCKMCRQEELGCSLVTGGFYPCQRCRDEDNECQLIVPPTKKGPCKQCVEDEQDVCSFEIKSNQASCDRCLHEEHVCRVSPPKGYRSDRIIIDEVRPHITCTRCRLEKRRCSLKKKTDKAPCKYCKNHSIGCTFYDLPKKDSKKKAGKAKNRIEAEINKSAEWSHAYFTPEDLEDLNNTDEGMQSRSPTPEIEMEDDAGQKGLLTKIKTSFSHPIQFGTIANTPDCNFCELPIFGVVGLFEKQVHVICWYNGLGYTEVGGGHAHNNGPTTMCQACTIDRAQIMSCERHDIQRMYPGDITPGFEEALADLLEVAEAPDEIKLQHKRWCSMCFSPATSTCCTRQVSLLSPDEAEQEIDGCGLRVCDHCAKQLKEVFGGDSSAMAAKLDLEPKTRELDEDVQGLVIRADVGFLSREGLLMKNIESVADEVEN